MTIATFDLHQLQVLNPDLNLTMTAPLADFFIAIGNLLHDRMSAHRLTQYAYLVAVTDPKSERVRILKSRFEPIQVQDPEKSIVSTADFHPMLLRALDYKTRTVD
jgi:hypothetical protein